MTIKDLPSGGRIVAVFERRDPLAQSPIIFIISGICTCGCNVAYSNAYALDILAYPSLVAMCVPVYKGLPFDDADPAVELFCDQYQDYLKFIESN